MSTAHKPDSEFMPEHFDCDELFARNVTQMAEWIRTSRHLIFYTGAGISTSAGIPDFRGPQGVWTLRASGEKRTAPTVAKSKAMPTPAHMSLVALERAGISKCVISQNCDGLHLRSGLSRNRLAELHGNTNLERCRRCGREVLRDYRVALPRSKRIRRKNGKRSHYTGRNCASASCGGKLDHTTVAFGENLPDEAWDRAETHARQADLCIVLGSSCTVVPAANLPDRIARRGDKLVIVNLQKTPLNHLASLVIHSKIDEVMVAVMEKLGMEIPKWELHRRIMVRWDEAELRLGGVETGDATMPYEILRAVRMSVVGPNESESETETETETGSSSGTRRSRPLSFRSQKAPHVFQDPRILGPDANHLRAELRFFQHYGEPDLVVPLSRPQVEELGEDGRMEIEVNAFYDPLTRVWRLE